MFLEINFVSYYLTVTLVTMFIDKQIVINLKHILHNVKFLIKPHVKSKIGNDTNTKVSHIHTHYNTYIYTLTRA